MGLGPLRAGSLDLVQEALCPLQSGFALDQSLQDVARLPWPQGHYGSTLSVALREHVQHHGGHRNARYGVHPSIGAEAFVHVRQGLAV